MIINALTGTSSALGKGEVDSSILSGSTSYAAKSMHWWTALRAKPGSTRPACRTKHEA
jgi:hypothetical protein